MLLRIHADNDLKAMYSLLNSNHEIRLKDGEAILKEKKVCSYFQHSSRKRLDTYAHPRRQNVEILRAQCTL